MKLNIRKINLALESKFFMEGSVLQGTLRGGGSGFDTRIEIESDEPPNEIQKLVDTAERSCFAIQSVAQPVETSLCVTLNGTELGLGGDG